MGSSLFFSMNLILIVGSVIMGLIFWVLPLSTVKGLNNYRISLKVLSVAYFVIGGLTIIQLYLGLPEVRLLSFIDLVIASLQAILFAFTLIILFNPSFVTRRFLIIQFFPVLFIIALWTISMFLWGNPILQNVMELRQNVNHPTVAIRILFVLFYIFQLVYFSWLFFGEEKKYTQQLDNYFSDNDRLQLKWVRYCYYAALVIATIAMFSFFFYSPVWVTACAGIYAFFYIGFGLYYIQYPKTFMVVEKAIDDALVVQEELEKDQRQLTWDKLRQRVIDEKYYLKTGVNIEEVAMQLQIGRTTLSGLINKEECVNFNMWINMLRVNKAKELLVKNPQWSILQVAEQVGFSEQSNFSRQFKLITHESPSVWRQQNLS